MCCLDSQQGAEMNEVISQITQLFSEDLDRIFNENDKGDILKHIWENDVTQNRKDFLQRSGSKYCF